MFSLNQQKKKKGELRAKVEREGSVGRGRGKRGKTAQNETWRALYSNPKDNEQ